ncbi:MAG: hypothetical protein NXI10_08760 [bacterium]|nr:hypothetical protein [bacterium]
MGETVDITPGEISIAFDAPRAGKISLKELGVTDEQLVLEGGFLRLVFNLSGIGEHHYYQMPTVEFAYAENCSEIHWQCDFNGETILDTLDHHGHTSVLLLNRKKLESLEHRHENVLIIHGEFPEPLHLNAENSYINFFR